MLIIDSNENIQDHCTFDLPHTQKNAKLIKQHIFFVLFGKVMSSKKSTNRKKVIRKKFQSSQVFFFPFYILSATSLLLKWIFGMYNMCIIYYMAVNNNSTCSLHCYYLLHTFLCLWPKLKTLVWSMMWNNQINQGERETEIRMIFNKRKNNLQEVSTLLLVSLLFFYIYFAHSALTSFAVLPKKIWLFWWFPLKLLFCSCSNIKKIVVMCVDRLLSKLKSEMRREGELSDAERQVVAKMMIVFVSFVMLNVICCRSAVMLLSLRKKEEEKDGFAVTPWTFLVDKTWLYSTYSLSVPPSKKLSLSFVICPDLICVM